MSKSTLGDKISHLDERGHMHMVDIHAKSKTKRVAVAAACVALSEAAAAQIAAGTVEKGDVFAAARLAGIMAAKRAASLIPLCHPVSLTHVGVELALAEPGVQIQARAETVGRTGVEMEAMTAATVAALTLYDMLKSIDKGITITSIGLLHKSGGKSGTWNRSSNAPGES